MGGNEWRAVRFVLGLTPGGASPAPTKAVGGGRTGLKTPHYTAVPPRLDLRAKLPDTMR
jgi:hypothetical protein